MHRQKSFEKEQPSIYLVPTPIGNLQEVSERTRDILQKADLIACEDTRNTGKLLHLLGIRKPLLSHHEHNAASSIPKILEQLEEGKSVAVLSDAGYPIISDPGAGLVMEAVEKDIPVICISGPNAALNALAASGLPAAHFLFYGFLDAKTSARKKQLEGLKDLPYTLLFYEAPHRIRASLEDMLAVFGNRKAVLARELTKLHEEYIRGSLQEILEVSGDLKGEMVVIVEGKTVRETVDLQEACQMVFTKMEEGMKTKQAVKLVSELLGISKNELYRQVLARKEQEGNQ